ncbi:MULTISPECIES: hypothetical protein [Bacteria]|jgi:hypothetical protein
MGTSLDSITDTRAMELRFYENLRDLALSFSRTGQVTSVAVVGNQPLDPSTDRAAIIDGADIVFRVNGFALDPPGSPATVGTRADVVVFNRGVRPSPWFFESYAERLYLLVEPGMLLDENPKIPDFWPEDLGALTVPNREVVLPLGSAIGIDPRAEGQWATTGTIMLWIALNLFPELRIDAAGFSFVDEPSQSEWRHAYGDSSPVGTEHRIAAEAALIRSLIGSGRVALHR